MRAQVEPAGSLQDSEGFADGCPRHAELRRNDIFHKMGTRWVGPVDDLRLELDEHSLREDGAIRVDHW
jgi:hypothetical protein